MGSVHNSPLEGHGIVRTQANGSKRQEYGVLSVSNVGVVVLLGAISSRELVLLLNACFFLFGCKGSFKAGVRNSSQLLLPIAVAVHVHARGGGFAAKLRQPVSKCAEIDR